MNKVFTIKQDSSLEKIDVEIRNVFDHLIKDIFSDSKCLKFSHCEMAYCSNVSEIFSPYTTWKGVFLVDWSQDTIKVMNSGLSGLILDEFGKNNVFSKVFFDKFFCTLNYMLSLSSSLKDELTRRLLEEICRKYKNKYKLYRINNISFIFRKRKDGNSIPEICIEVITEKDS